MLRITLAGLCLLAATRVAHADRFHFAKPGDRTAAASAQLDTVEGVLLKDENGIYTIRVEGGTIEIDKKLVTKVEKTDLTLQKIEDREKAATAKLADSNRKRREVQATEASASKRELDARAAEAPKEKELKIVVDFQGLLPNYTFRTYDPVLHRVNMAGLAAAVERYFREEIERAAGRKPQ